MKHQCSAFQRALPFFLLLIACFRAESNVAPIDEGEYCIIVNIEQFVPRLQTKEQLTQMLQDQPSMLRLILAQAVSVWLKPVVRVVQNKNEYCAILVDGWSGNPDGSGISMAIDLIGEGLVHHADDDLGALCKVCIEC